MKLTKPLVWKSSLVALGMLSIVSLHSVGAQTTTTTPSAGNSVTTPANGTNGNTANNGGHGPGDNGGDWDGGRGGMMGGQGGMMGGQGGMFGGRHGGMHGNGRGRFGANAMIGGVSVQSISTYLGLTTEQLKADLDAGQSLAQIAVAQGKTSDDLRAFMIQQSTAAIDAALNQTTTSKANGSGATTGGNGTIANSTPSAAATPAV